MEYAHIIVEEKDSIGRIVLNRPPLNVLNIAMMREINDALSSFQTKTLKALVIKAEGKAFSAGVDVAEHTAEKVEEMIHVFHEIFKNLQGIGAPTVALVNGAALGGGCEVASFCDIVIASEKAKFGQPEIKVGVFAPVAAALLPKIMGSKKAIEFLLTGESLSASDARDTGLVNHVIPVENFDAEAEQFVREMIASKSAVVLHLTKRALLEGMHRSYSEAIKRIEALYLNDLMRTSDAREGLAAFLEKRQPVWRDE
ncbi:MAG: enoyl-CoA hydratase/isomerase family protein [Candidatus Thermoplasmatota archaeon]